MRPSKNAKVEKVLISESNQKYYVTNLAQEFITKEGIISVEDLQNNQNSISSKGKKFSILKPSFIDFWEGFERGPQIIQHKEIGLIIAKTGLCKDWVCVDAGAGTGSLCLSLAKLTKHVTCYDIKKSHLNVVEKNKAMCGIENLELKHGDVGEELSEENLDLITLDLPEPWAVLEKAQKSLKHGGFLVVYLPNIVQMQQFVISTRGTPFKVLEVSELIERQWKVSERIVRPEYGGLSHTGFLAFCRKL